MTKNEAPGESAATGSAGCIPTYLIGSATQSPEALRFRLAALAAFDRLLDLGASAQALATVRLAVELGQDMETPFTASAPIPLAVMVNGGRDLRLLARLRYVLEHWEGGDRDPYWREHRNAVRQLLDVDMLQPMAVQHIETKQRQSAAGRKAQGHGRALSEARVAELLDHARRMRADRPQLSIARVAELIAAEGESVETIRKKIAPAWPVGDRRRGRPRTK